MCRRNQRGAVMMRKNTGLILLVLLFYSKTLASDNLAFDVLTEQLHMLTFTEVKYGYHKIISEGVPEQIGADSHGNPIWKDKGIVYELIETSTIPLRMGHGFGFEYIIPFIQNNDQIVIDIVLELPRPINTGENTTKIINASITYQNSDSHQTKYVRWFFRADKPQYNIEGIWKMQLFNDGILLISKKFEVQK
jgi:hypothetical protein